MKTLAAIVIAANLVIRQTNEADFAALWPKRDFHACFARLPEADCVITPPSFERVLTRSVGFDAAAEFPLHQKLPGSPQLRSPLQAIAAVPCADLGPAVVSM